MTRTALVAALAASLVASLGLGGDAPVAPWARLACAAVVVVAAIVWWRRPPIVARRLGPTLLSLAAALSLVAAVSGLRPPMPLEEIAAEAAPLYADTWRTLDETARIVAATLDGTLDGERLADARSRDEAKAAQLELFETLRAATVTADPVLTVLLFDPDGEARAWRGPGLLHEPQGYDLPRRGRAWRRGFMAATLMSVEPVDDSRRPWRVLIGRSLSMTPFPFSGAPLTVTPRWSVGEPGALSSEGLEIQGLDSQEPDIQELEVQALEVPLVARRAAAEGDPDRVDGPSLYLEASPEAVAVAPRPLARAALLLVALTALLDGLAELLRRAAGREDEGAPVGRAAVDEGTVDEGTVDEGTVDEGTVDEQRAVFDPAAAVAAAGAAALTAALLDAAASPWPVLWVFVGVAAGLRVVGPRVVGPRVVGERSERAATAIGAFGPPALVGLAWLELWRRASGTGVGIGASGLDLSVRPFGVSELAYAVACAGLTAAVVQLAAGRGSAPGDEPDEVDDGSDERASVTDGDLTGWAAGLLALAGAAAHDRAWLAVPCLALAGGLAARWWRRGRAGAESGDGAGSRLPRPGAAAGLVLLAVLIGVGAWQTAHRDVFRRHVETISPRLAPPSVEEANALLVALQEHFEAIDLAPLRPPPTSLPAEAGDLAFALWRQSPLARRDALSAVVIDGPGGVASFSFGLPLDDDLESHSSVIRSTGRLPSAAEVWTETLMRGEAPLRLGGVPWGEVRYFLLPRPGFRLVTDELGELEAALVRGEQRPLGVDGLPPGLLYALYETDGGAISTPWTTARPMPQSLLERAPASGGPPTPDDTRPADDLVTGVTPTPRGDAWFWMRREADGLEVLLLPVRGALSGLEAVGIPSLAVLVVLSLVLAAAAPLAVGRSAPRRIVHRLVGSYSRRLILVYTVLLLLPMIALNLFLLRTYGERLREEQLADAQSAVDSARTLLFDYLSGLEPGFSFEIEVNRDLLEWISGLIDHEINFYWGSQLFASSQDELFSADLLPGRIPGEVYTRLALRGADNEVHVQRTGGVAYLEFFAPLDTPELLSEQQGVFLSVPLLAQSEAAERELTALAWRAALVTASLFVLLFAVGSRLTRSFTRPILQLIDDTRRVAAGMPTSRVEPRDEELADLADAIDVMAGRVAESRRRLLAEKGFVERVVANITSGVVSLDSAGRVQVQNRVAAELLGASTGDVLETHLGARRQLRPVAEFLAEARAGGVQRAERVKLRPADDQVDVWEWALTWVPLPGDEDPSELLVLDDATEVLRGQRLEAWAEMARIIAHEIKNPLTPIRLSTEHLQQVWRQKPERIGEVVERVTGNVLRHVEELREIASEFSIYSRIPLADLRAGDVVEAVEELARGYADVGGRGVALTVETPAEPQIARFDRKLLGRALRNLLENAVRAAGEGGTVSVRVEPVPSEAADPADPDDGDSSDREAPSLVRITVVDSGPGVDPQKLERIFEPYFSTYETGTGLGLAITKRIAEQHGGTIEARNRPDGGLAVAITVPAVSGPRPAAEDAANA